MGRQPPDRVVSREQRAWTDETDAWKQDRAIRKGYRIRWGYVAIAYVVEALVICTSLAGAWFFAETYADRNDQSFWFMLLAPIVYAAIELCRVPLGILIRVQRDWLIKGLAVIGIVMAAGVTTKSVSQLGEMMFHPRLAEASKARTALREAEADRGTIDNRIAQADARVAQYAAEAAALEKRTTEASSQLAGLPGQRCERLSGTNSRGKRYSYLRCVTDPRTATIAGSLKSAGDERAVVARNLAEARAARAQLDRAAADRRVTEAEGVYRDAVRRSQLHSFTAMVYGADPVDVTDQQVHAFLRVFVFAPALCAAFASTLLALCAVQVRRTYGDEDDLDAVMQAEGVPLLLNQVAESATQIQDAQRAMREAAVASGAAIPLDQRRSPTVPQAGTPPSPPARDDDRIERPRP
ncbi:ATPase [Methylobacterium nonmethylotrophicum]|uniref:ATPase n=1 Tax=Methylobacterium nonmethylotrophicum TaxID=1141884 RepID=A0A4Z0NJV2_9HYPH|nr:ATPase [Methylobacterium nonmethylotrophicum]TGD96131.1 ATPase [Methylobacterium nonmethylotrophicum]